MRREWVLLAGRVEQPSNLLRLAQVIVEVDGILRRHHMNTHSLLLEQLERLGTNSQSLQHTLRQHDSRGAVIQQLAYIGGLACAPSPSHASPTHWHRRERALRP